MTSLPRALLRMLVRSSSTTGKSDVAFEQSFANFGERGVQVLFGELALAAKILEGALQLFCKVFKHERKFSEARDQNSVFDDSAASCDATEHIHFRRGESGGQTMARKPSRTSDGG